jgi:hypothetical protein
MACGNKSTDALEVNENAARTWGKETRRRTTFYVKFSIIESRLEKSILIRIKHIAIHGGIHSETIEEAPGLQVDFEDRIAISIVELLI